jgi:hypothetical protein
VALFNLVHYIPWWWFSVVQNWQKRGPVGFKVLALSG